MIRSTARKVVNVLLEPKTTARRYKQKFRARDSRIARWTKYEKWIKKNSGNLSETVTGPLISILLPTYNTDVSHLKKCIESVMNQKYKNWQLCIVDDRSTDPSVWQVIKEYVKKDKRIVGKLRAENGHICAASNDAFAISKGEYVALLDHDDLIYPDALSSIAEVIATAPETDMIYTDEDKLNRRGKRVEPFFKPDYSPNFLRSCNYITHFTCFRRSLFDKVGGFSLGTEGAQDWDLILRMTEQTNNIKHIPKVLYSWRMSDSSTASNSGSKPYAYVNQLKVLRDHMMRKKVSASVLETGFLGLWNVKPVISRNIRVSVVIPTKNSYDLISTCINSIFDLTSYCDFEIVLVDTGTDQERVWDLYDKFTKRYPGRFRVVKQGGIFNFTRACNSGAKAAVGEYLLFLNNDTKVINSEWMDNLLGLAEYPTSGAVGARLYYEDYSIQHIGVHLSPTDIAHHTFIGKDEKNDPYVHILLHNIRECSAITGACLMVSAKKFWRVGGFDKQLRVTYNDVDLCLKLNKIGLLNIYTPHAVLFHFESKSVGKIGTNSRDMEEFEAAKKLMQTRWHKELSDEKYFRDPL